MMGLWISFIALGALFCFAGLVVGYLGLLSGVFPEKLRTREVGTVVTADLWKLRICRFRRGRTEGEPVLFVHGLGTNHHNFTEPANACLVDYLVERGYDCWALDLRGTRSSKAPFERDPMAVHLDDFLLQDIPAAIEHIRRATGYAKVHYVGHSLGGMMLYAYAQEFGTERIASGVAIGTPMGFDGVRAKAGLVFLPIIQRYPLLCADLLKGMLPFIAPLRVNVGVFPLNARNVHSSLKVSDFYNMIDIPVPSVLGEMAHMITRKAWRMKADSLDIKAGLSSMDFPLMVVYGARDPFTPLDKAKLFFDDLPTSDKQMLVCSKEQGCKHDYGHCDLAFGVDGTKAVFRPIAEWLAAHPIKERLAHTAEDDAHIMTPIDGDARAEMLSGDRYAKAHEESPVPSSGVDTPPEAVFPEETSELLRERHAALQGIAQRTALARDKSAAPKAAPKKKATADKSAPAKPKAAPAKKATAATKPATETKPAPKATAAPAVTASPKAKAASSKPKAAATPKATGAAKPKAAPTKKAVAAKPEPKAKPATTKPPAAKPKAVLAKAKPTKSKPGTLDVLKAASEELKKLDKRK